MPLVPSSPLRVLVVCTANICRSPMGAALLATACGERGVDVAVSSAGFLFDGHPASDATRKVMRSNGFDVDAHRSRIIDADIVHRVDLVLTMERRHARDVLLDIDPAAPVMTFKGFAALASQIAASMRAAPTRSDWDLRSFVESALAMRTPNGLLGDGRPDEVGDPHGRSARVHRKAFEEIAGVAAVIGAAFGDARATP